MASAIPIREGEDAVVMASASSMILDAKVLAIVVALTILFLALKLCRRSSGHPLSSVEVDNPSHLETRVINNLLRSKLDKLNLDALKTLCHEFLRQSVGQPTRAMAVEFLIAKRTTSDATVCRLFDAEATESCVSVVDVGAFFLEAQARSFLS
jgi:hypothetical protein